MLIFEGSESTAVATHLASGHTGPISTRVAHLFNVLRKGLIVA
jgi:hypothetical protein